MASLVKLPVETLHKICSILAHTSTESIRNLCLASKSLNEICSPCLIYQWGDNPDSPDPPLQLFVLHLFKNPDLRKKVKRLGIGRESATGESTKAVVDLDKEKLSEIAKAAASDIKLDPEYLTPLCSDIEKGSADALNALLLAWCTGVTYLSITVPSFVLIDGEQSHVLTFAKQAILRILSDEPRADDLSFTEVRHLQLHHLRENQYLFFEAATIFFHLPKIKSLVSSGLCDYSIYLEMWSNGTFAPFAGDYGRRYALAIPDASSGIDELEITGAGFARDGLPTLLRGIRNLKRLTLETIMEYGDETPDREEIAENLQICQSSVEDMDLQTQPHGYLTGPDSRTLDYQRVANEMLVEEDVYKDFVNLRRLSCPMTDILSLNSDDEESIVPGSLPESIEYLKPRCHDMVVSWKSKDQCVEPYIEAFITILKEAGPDQRLCNLKVLDLSDTFVDDPETDGIGKIKEVAEAQGIKLLLK